MNFAFTDEQNELRKSARRFLATESSSEKVRAAMTTELGYDPEVWSKIATELGWVALVIPEEYDGLGLGPVDLVPLLEEMGRHLYCGPFFSTVCLGVATLLEAGTEEQKKQYLPSIAAGELTATLAFTEANGRWDSSAIEATATKDGSDYVLSGTKRYVLDGHTAGLVLVAARTPGSKGDEGVSVFALAGDTPGLSRTMLPTIDTTRRQAELVLDGVRIPASARLGEEGAAWKSLRLVLDRAAAALAAEQVGGAEACLDLAVEYAKVRKQFGRPIGSFQAIQHMAANMLLLVESARSAAYYANAVAAIGGPELAEAAALAKAYCSDAYFQCAAESIQIHGGIGFTWEHDAPLFFKRAKSSETLLGDATHHREIVAREIGL
ncbi:MAG: acyl-CoA dehydrogenase family protein [Polyangiales bacterium]